MTIYDYQNQAWIVDGRYVRCGHPESMNCACYGRLHEGEKADNGDTEDDTIICPKCGSDDAEECRQLDRDGALLGTWKSCPRCEHQWDVNF